MREAALNAKVHVSRIALDQNDLLVWQLADSAFPAGGFAHSGGLEAAAQHGEITNRSELVHFIKNALQQVGHGSVPFLSGAHKSPGDFGVISQHFETFTSNHVANRASRLQGRAFLASSVRIFPAEALKYFQSKVNEQNFPMHFAPIFGTILSLLHVAREAACRIFLFIHLRGLLSSAVRLGLVGPLEGQGIQYQLTGCLEAIFAECINVDYKAAAQTNPLSEIWQANQDRLYSRLFQS
jgi:urease accessory protein